MRLLLVVPATAFLLMTVSPAFATNCNTVVACVLGQNSSAGASSDIGVEGLSQHGFGLVGVTSANPASSNGRVAGLYGKDQGATRYNSGVSAFSQNGTGLIAFGVLGDGIDGITTATAGGASASAVQGADNGQNVASTGVAGLSNYGTGAYGESANGDGMEAVADSSGRGLFASSASGTAMVATTQGGGLALDASGGSQIQAVEVDTIGTGDLLAGFNTATQGTAALIFDVDASGNETIAGSLTTSGGTLSRTRSSVGADVASYDARSASPTLEDFGQGSLRQGYGHVALDPTYASTIDTRSYLVFVTPHGDSHSLYTTTLGSKGFDVHESELGRSSLSFDYRIVGRPLDMAAGHLPAVSTLARFNGTTKAHRMLAKPLARLQKLAARRPF